VITLIGVIMIIQATFTIVGGIVALALNTQDRLLQETSLTSSDLVTSGIVSLVVGGLVLIVALLLLSGSRLARGLIAAVQVINVAAATWFMFAHHTGAYVTQGLITVGVAIFVLWALYNERSDAYFESAA
jgi:hypothetical protein